MLRGDFLPFIQHTASTPSPSSPGPQTALQVIGDQLDKLEHSDRARRYGYSTAAATEPRALKVYLRQNDETLTPATPGSTVPLEVTLTLPVAGSTEAAIDQILAQCGLPVAPGGGSTGAGPGPAVEAVTAWAAPVVVGFPAWAAGLPFGAFDTMRAAADQNAALRKRNQLLSRELRRKFQLSGLANESRWSCAVAERVALATLESTLRKLSPPVGTSLAFAHASSGFDNDGRIVLGLDDTSDTWLAWLKKRIQHDAALKDLHSRRRHIEVFLAWA